MVKFCSPPRVILSKSSFQSSWTTSLAAGCSDAVAWAFTTLGTFLFAYHAIFVRVAHVLISGVPAVDWCDAVGPGFRALPALAEPWSLASPTPPPGSGKLRPSLCSRRHYCQNPSSQQGVSVRVSRAGFLQEDFNRRELRSAKSKGTSKQLPRPIGSGVQLPQSILVSFNPGR